MARPTKPGLDYFPFDVDFFSDDKLRLVEAEHGITGLIIAIKLLCKIYKEKGYYYQWGEDECLLFSKNIGVEVNSLQVNHVVRSLLKREFFDSELFDRYTILTSRGIQKRYFEAVERRKSVDVITDIILIDNIKGKNVNNYTFNVCNNPQSKVKESKVKETKTETKVSVVDALASTPEQVGSDFSKVPRNIPALIAFIRVYRPQEPQPYFELFNLWAFFNRRGQVNQTDIRLRKLRERLSEEEFDFALIMSIVSTSHPNDLPAKFSFDWLIDKPAHYRTLLGTTIHQTTDNG